MIIFISLLIATSYGEYVPEYNGQKDRYNEALLRNDPEVLISRARHDSSMNSLATKQNKINELDSIIKRLSYDAQATTIGESRTPDKVIADGKGNCFEVARLAYYFLFKEGYTTRILNLKFKNQAVYHSICVFQELDGTWSMVQINSINKGYSPIKASSIEELVKKEFQDHVESVIILL